MTAACTREDRSPPVQRTDSAGITIVESSAPVWDAGDAWRIDGPLVSIGAVDGPPATQLHRVRGVGRLADGRIVVANGNPPEIRLYDSSGAWIRSTGGDGDGPGEFRVLLGIQIVQPDTVLVFDDRGPRVTTLTGHGAVSDNRRIASLGTMVKPPDHRLPDGRWLDLAATPEIVGYQRRRNSFVRWSEANTATDTLLSRDGYEYLIYVRQQGDRYIGKGVIVVPFGGKDLSAIGPGRVALSDGQAYDVAVAELDGRQLRIRRPVERRPLAAGDVARFIDDYVDGYPAERQQQVRQQFDGVKAPSLTPSHSSLVFDAAGNLWVENYRLPWDETTPRTWSVFERDGRWLGDLVVPLGLRVAEIGEDHVAGVERDESGVEFVRVYRLVKP